MRWRIASRKIRGNTDIAVLIVPVYPGTYTSAPRPRRTARTMASPTTVGSTGRTPRAEPSPSAISVAMIAGMTMETAIPLPRSSPRSDSLSPTTACLVAEYVAPPGDAILPATEPRLTIWPRPRGPHPGKRELRASQHATEVDGDLSAGGRVALVPEQSYMLNARVVHHHVQRTESVFNLAQK